MVLGLVASVVIAGRAEARPSRRVPARVLAPRAPSPPAPPATVRPARTAEAPEESLHSRFLDVADLFVSERQFDKAIQVYERLLRQHPEAVEVRIKLAEACMQSKRCAPRQQMLLSAALEAGADREDLVEDLHGLLTALGDHQQAMRILRGYLERFPTNGLIRRLAAETLTAAGDLHAALEEARRGRAASPEDVELRLLEIDLLEQVKDHVALARAAQELLRLHPDYADAWVILGELALASGDTDGTEKAIAAARTGIMHDPEAKQRLTELEADLKAELLDANEDRPVPDFRRDVQGADAREDIDADSND